MDKPFALIIEDDRDIAALYRHILDVAGYRTEIAFHGKVAAERISNSQPDLVLLDLSIPGISGSQILEMIRKDGRLDQTKIIVITAHAHIAAGLSAQPDLLLHKPVSTNQLIKLIGRITLSKSSRKPTPMQPQPLDNHTGLYNKSFFINRLESALKQAKEIETYLFGVFLFSVEQKKRGTPQAAAHSWESTLREIAGSLRCMLRPTDTLARFNPNTFYVLIENIPNGEIAKLIATRIQARLNGDIVDLEDKINIPIRIGILLCDSGYNNPDEILNDAKYAQALTVAQGDEYANFYYQFSVKR